MYDSTLFFSHLNKENFRFLAQYRDLFCISIFVPVRLQPGEVIDLISTEMDRIYKIDPIKLNNQGLNRTVEQQFMRQVKRILDEWEQHPVKQPLAFFISNELIEVVQLSKTHPFKFYLSDHFYLKPIADSFNSDSEFLFIHLSSSRAKAYLVNQRSIERLGQVKNFSRRESNNGESLKNYSEKIGRWINESLPQNSKIVLAGLPALLEEFARSSPIETSRLIRSLPVENKQLTYKQIRKESSDIIQELKEKGVQNWLRRIKEKDTRYKLLSDIEQILSYSLKGKIKHLFLSKEKERFGEFDDENNFLLPVSPGDHLSSLSNVAALHTIRNKGNVYLLPQAALPDSGAFVNAVILR